VVKLLALRIEQLKTGLEMEVWSDAFRTSQTIFKLTNYLKKQIQLPYLLELNENMSKIFFHSKHYLFHTYALYNLTHAVKRNLRWSDAKKHTLTCKFVLAALSCPLNHSLSNFERLSTQYLPRELQDDTENSQKIRTEVFEVSSMLYITGVPSRASLINMIN